MESPLRLWDGYGASTPRLWGVYGATPPGYGASVGHPLGLWGICGASMSHPTPAMGHQWGIPIPSYGVSMRHPHPGLWGIYGAAPLGNVEPQKLRCFSLSHQATPLPTFSNGAPMGCAPNLWGV